MPDINLISPAGGRMVKEDNSTINIADIYDKQDEIPILSTETKPTTNIPNGKKLLEVDTKNGFIFYKGTWYPL